VDERAQREGALGPHDGTGRPRLRDGGQSRSELRLARLGSLPLADIKGKVVVVYWSWDVAHGGVRWERIGRRVD